jgi:hypothetical protein
VAVTFLGVSFVGGSPISINATPRTTAPNLRNVSTNTSSSTGFTLHAWNGSASATDVIAEWVAVQNDNGSALGLLAEDETHTTATVTCPTPDCENQGIPIDIAVTYLNDDGEEVAVDAVQCGVCGTELEF